MRRREKIIIKLVMMLLGIFLVFPGKVFAAEKEEITEKNRLYFC